MKYPGGVWPLAMSAFSGHFHQNYMQLGNGLDGEILRAERPTGDGLFAGIPLVNSLSDPEASGHVGL